MPNRYRDKRTERLANREFVDAFSAIARQALRKLDRITTASTIQDLRVPPSNHLEKLRGDRYGQWSIRVNDQWRICFEWPDDSPEPFNIEITDYH